MTVFTCSFLVLTCALRAAWIVLHRRADARREHTLEQLRTALNLVVPATPWALRDESYIGRSLQLQDLAERWAALPIPTSRAVLLISAHIPLERALTTEVLALTDSDLQTLAALNPGPPPPDRSSRTL